MNSGSIPGNSCSAEVIASSVANAFWWQCPWIATRHDAVVSKSKRSCSCDRAINSSSNSDCSDNFLVKDAVSKAGYSSRKVSRHDGSRPMIGVPRSRCGVNAEIKRRASVRASSISPALRKVRPQQSGRALMSPAICTRQPSFLSTEMSAWPFSGSK